MKVANIKGKKLPQNEVKVTKEKKKKECKRLRKDNKFRESFKKKK